MAAAAAASSAARCILDGNDILKLGRAGVRKMRGARVCYVAQSAAAAFNPARKLGDQVVEAAVAHGLMARGEAQRRAVDLFGMLGLPSPETFGSRYPHQVSGGQLQRAMTAMALCPKPDLIVFDEPTTALDVTTQIDVLAAIKRAIEETGTAALYITHDLAVVAQVSDDIMVLRHGKTVEYGSVQQIIEAPKEDYTRQPRLDPQDAEGGRAGPIGRAAQGRACRRRLRQAADPARRDAASAAGPDAGRGRRIRFGKVDAGAGRHRACCRRAAARWTSRARRSRRRCKDRSREELRALQMIYQMADVAMNPRQTVRQIIGRPLTVLFRHPRARRRRAASKSCSTRSRSARASSTATRRNSPAARSSASASPARLPPNPKLIICDEPTSALDPLVADGILKLLMRLQEETRCLLSFHHPRHRDRARHRRFDRGDVSRPPGALRPEDEVLSPPFDDYTDLLLSSVPEMEIGWLEKVLKTRKMASAGN